jgi:hypothetical protein
MDQTQDLDQYHHQQEFELFDGRNHSNSLEMKLESILLPDEQVPSSISIPNDSELEFFDSDRDRAHTFGKIFDFLAHEHGREFDETDESQESLEQLVYKPSNYENNIVWEGIGAYYGGTAYPNSSVPNSDLSSDQNINFAQSFQSNVFLHFEHYVILHDMIL